MSIMHPLIPALCAALVLTLPARAEGLRGAAGIAVAIGGALRYDNDAVWSRLVELSGGAGARWVVLPTASQDPAKSGAASAKALTARGAVVEVLPVSARLAAPAVAQAVRDADLVKKVREARGVYFTGGAQERITEALQAPDGLPTPLLEAIWAMYRSGGVVAGSSAGAAILSSTMIRDAQDVLPVLRHGAREGREIAPGLGFVGPDIFVDQHFLKRGRVGRMLPVMAQKNLPVGVGIDEDSAVVFRGTTLEVLGYKGALVVDLREAEGLRPLPPFAVRNARLTYLDRGDRYDLATRELTASAAKRAGTRIDPRAANFRPHYQDAPFSSDILGDTVIVNLMARLLDNAHTEALGLALGSPTGPHADLAFTWRLHKGPDTAGWFTSAFGGEDYTIAEMRLDVTPVRLAKPLYAPLETKP